MKVAEKDNDSKVIKLNESDKDNKTVEFSKDNEDDVFTNYEILLNNYDNYKNFYNDIDGNNDYFDEIFENSDQEYESNEEEIYKGCSIKLSLFTAMFMNLKIHSSISDNAADKKLSLIKMLLPEKIKC